MTHIWLRAEERESEERVGLTPEGAAALIAQGMKITVEESPARVIPVEGYIKAGCATAPFSSWADAPQDAIIFGLKELPETDQPLHHRHIMFGHAYKGQPAGQRLLKRFKAGGGTLYDLEYLVDENGRRVAAFGYWAGFAGAALSLKALIAQPNVMGPIQGYPNKDALIAELQREMKAIDPPRAIIIGALGRVGTGARDLCAALGIPVTAWDMAETASGGPFPEILDHEMFLNCILADPSVPVFVPRSAKEAPRALRVIGDIACDPSSDFSPIKVYDHVTTWGEPALRVHDVPPLDVMAIDNLPSLLPLESSEDYAAQLLPSLHGLGDLTQGVWGRAKARFDHHIAQV